MTARKYTAIRIEEELLKDIQRIADESSCSMAAVVRQACKRYIEYKDAEKHRLTRYYESERGEGHE